MMTSAREYGIWSKKTYRLSEVMSSPGNQVLYYLAHGLERAFIKEELMLIPEDTKLPPDFVQNDENIPASKNGIFDSRTTRGEQSCMWANPKIVRSAN